MTEKSDYITALRYRWLTPFYDWTLAISMRDRAFKRRLIEHAAIQSAENVLDLGCGTATLSLMILEACPDAEVVGLDGDPEILTTARRKTERLGAALTLKQGLADALPFEENRFDTVVSSLVFHHLNPEAKGAALRETLRVLKPGGRLWIADWGPSANVAMRLAFYPVQWLDGFETTRDHVAGRLPQFIAEAGFHDVGIAESTNTLFGTLSFYRGTRP